MANINNLTDEQMLALILTFAQLWGNGVVTPDNARAAALAGQAAARVLLEEEDPRA